MQKIIQQCAANRRICQDTNILLAVECAQIMGIHLRKLSAFWLRYLLLAAAWFVLLEILVLVGAQSSTGLVAGVTELQSLLSVPVFYAWNFFHFVRFNPGVFADLSVVGLLFHGLLVLYASLPAAIIASYFVRTKPWAILYGATLLFVVVAWILLRF